MSDNEIKTEEIAEVITPEGRTEAPQEEETLPVEETPVETVEQLEIVTEPGPIEEPVNEVKKVGTARLIYNDATTVYRFDIHFNPQYNSLEFKNVINGFEELHPKGAKGIKDFFAMYGIINWNFPKTVLAINTPEYLESMTKIENLLNQHIKSAGLKKFTFRVETV